MTLCHIPTVNNRLIENCRWLDRWVTLRRSHGENHFVTFEKPRRGVGAAFARGFVGLGVLFDPAPAAVSRRARGHRPLPRQSPVAWWRLRRSEQHVRVHRRQLLRSRYFIMQITVLLLNRRQKLLHYGVNIRFFNWNSLSAFFFRFSFKWISCYANQAAAGSSFAWKIELR